MWIAAGRRAGLLMLAAVAVAVATDRSAAEIVAPRGMIREQVWVPFEERGAAPVRLETMLVRPAAAGQHPLVLISHGSPRDRADAKTKSVDWADWIANDFAR